MGPPSVEGQQYTRQNPVQYFDLFHFSEHMFNDQWLKELK